MLHLTHFLPFFQQFIHACYFSCRQNYIMIIIQINIILVFIYSFPSLLSPIVVFIVEYIRTANRKGVMRLPCRTPPRCSGSPVNWPSTLPYICRSLVFLIASLHTILKFRGVLMLSIILGDLDYPKLCQVQQKLIQLVT